MKLGQFIFEIERLDWTSEDGPKKVRLTIKAWVIAAWDEETVFATRINSDGVNVRYFSRSEVYENRDRAKQAINDLATSLRKENWNVETIY